MNECVYVVLYVCMCAFACVRVNARARVRIRANHRALPVTRNVVSVKSPMSVVSTNHNKGNAISNVVINQVFFYTCSGQRQFSTN